MARLWSSGFELNSATTIEMSSNASAPVTVQSGTARSGTYAVRVTGLASGTGASWGYQYLSSEVASNLYYRFYFRAATFPSVENRIILFNDTASASGPTVYLSVDNSGVLRLYDEDGQITGTTTLSTNTWYNIEIHINTVPAGGSHVVEARVDGAAAFATSSTRNIAATNLPFWFLIGGNMGGEANTAGDWFFDDLAINDTTGSFQNSWPGEGKIIHLRPDSAGDSNTFATQTGGTAGAANNYTRVDEVTPNDATDFNGSNTLNQEDMFNVSDSGINSYDIVNVVSVGGRFRNSTADATTAVRFQIEKAAAGTISQSSSIVPNSTTWRTNIPGTTVKTYPITTYQDPDASDWTQSTLDSMQIGYKIQTGGTNRIDVSNVWALVDYTPGTPPGTAVKDMIGMGIIPFAR